VLAFIWSVTLQFSLVHSKPLYRDLGPAAAAAIGSALGFVVASAAGNWLPRLDVGTSELLVAGLAIAVLVAAGRS
jgi:hypothetical protein